MRAKEVYTNCLNLHGIVVILETEGDVIILLVGEGALGNLMYVILVGAIILRMIVINYDVLHGALVY